MNLFFGCLGSGGSFAGMKRAVERFYGTPVETLEAADGTVRCGFVRDGSIVGVARGPSGFLVYLGAIQRPLPEWPDAGSPLDSPDETARYLLTRYAALGPRFLEGVRGQYAVAVGDEGSRQLVLGSDPDGLRRLFHGEFDASGGLPFGTLPAALVGAERREIDRSLEDFVLGYEFMPWNRAIYRGTRFLRAGTVLACSQDGGTTVTELEQPPPTGPAYRALSNDEKSEEVVIGRLYDAFMKAVEDQCPSDRRVAVLLGGFDSALVAGALHRLGKQVETFTFHYADYGYNQAHTDTLANYLGSTHTDVVITEAVIRKGLEDYGLSFAHPMGQAHYVHQTQHTLRVMREHGYTHALSGDGCDGLFLGYPMVYRRAFVFGKLGVLPPSAVRLGKSLLGAASIEDRLGHTARLGRNALTVLGRRMPVRGHITNRILDEISLARLRVDGPPPNQFEPEQVLEELARDKGSMNLYRLAFKGKGAVGTNRNRNEGSTASAGVTLLSPFQHPGLKQVTSGIPQELLRPPGKSPGALGKYALLRMAEESGLLPREIIYQPKASPVTAPVDYWYAGALRNDVLRLVDDLPFAYDKDYVERLVAPKAAEEVFRRYGTIGRYASHAMSLLVTYASFNRVARAGADERIDA